MGVNNGLSVSDVVNVSVSLTPTGASQRNFGAMLILGDSTVIDTQERMRQYSSLTGVAGDFSSTAPEYLAAQLFFGQTPQPSILYVGRWAASATTARLRGGVLSAAQQAIANFTPVTSGGFKITIDGSQQSLTGINLSGVTTLNGVASAVTAALTGAICTWDATNQCFWITSTTTGSTATIGDASAPASGVDISVLMLLTASTAQYAVNGIQAETIESCVTTFLGLSNNWYMLSSAAATSITDTDMVSVGALIEAASPSRILLATTQEAGALSSSSTTDLCYLMQQAQYQRVYVQYSSASPYAACGAAGRAATVNFDGSSTTETLKFQVIAGLAPEYLTETQAAALTAKNGNVVVEYNDAAAILQQGTMANGYFFDEVQNSDWLQNAIQTAAFSALLSAGTKIPQTDAGVGVLVAAVTRQLVQAVTNGFIAPGVWQGPPVGNLSTGDTLSTGFYVYAPPVSSQSQSQRASRTAPLIQCAIKQAGAIHFAGITVSVNP